MPFVSEAQRRLMYAAAAGKKTKADISQKEAKKLVAEDEPGKLPEKVSKAEGDGSDMAKQLLAQINEMSEKLNEIISSDQELEDWVDSKIVTAKKDLQDIAGYLMHNEDAKKSIHGSKNTPDRTVSVVDSIAKADDMGDYEKKAAGALDFRNQMKQFRREHGSTIMDIVGGKKIPSERADAYHAARGQLMVGQGVSHADIPPRIPSHLIDRTPKQPEMLALPTAKSIEDLTKPKSLLQKMNDCTKCMRKNNEEELEKSSKKKSKPFHGYNKKKHARSGGLNDSYRKKLNRETGSNLKRPVTKKNVKPGSKAAKRRKSFCARMSGVKGPTSKDGKLTPKGAALKRWRCSKSLNKSESVPLELRAQKVLKSLDSLIKGDVIDFKTRKKINEEPQKKSWQDIPKTDRDHYLSTDGKTLIHKDDIKTVIDRERKDIHPTRVIELQDGSEHSVYYPTVGEMKTYPQAYNFDRWTKQLHLTKPVHNEDGLTVKWVEDTNKSLDSVNKYVKKSNVVKPFGEDIYDANANLGRKMGRTGEEIEGVGRNVAVQQYGSTSWGSSKEQAARQAKVDKEKSKKNPVTAVDLSKIPAAKREEVLSAYQAKRPHPLLSRAIKVLNEKKQSLIKENKLKGGKGDKKDISDFDPLETTKGKKVEMEHTKNPSIAQEISADHLSEDPKYYSKLKAAGLADELNKAYEILSKLEKRCWKGYRPVPGKEPYSAGSCAPIKKAISAQNMERGEYKGEKLDANHHNRLGREYKEMARRALKTNDKDLAMKYNTKSKYHFDIADQKGYSKQEE